MAVAVTPDNVTDYSFAQLLSALEKTGSCDARFIMAPAVGASLKREVKKSGVTVTDGSDLNGLIANW